MIPTYCITLRQTPERHRMAREHFAEIGLNVKFFQGIHGLTAGIKTETWSNKDYQITRGHLALCLNHWFLWNHLALIDPIPEEALILEDDVIFQSDFLEQFEITKSALPKDWDFWFVGTVGSESKKRIHVNDRICILEDCPFGTHAYVVQRTALQILISTNQTMQHHIDQQLWHNSLPHLKWYVSWPNLAKQHTYEGTWPLSCYDGKDVKYAK